MRDKSLRMTFSSLSAATNQLAVGNALSSESGIIALTNSGTAAWGFGYSDALNLNRFSSTFADAVSFSAQANPSASGTLAPLPSSTAYGEYNVRIAIGTSQMFGPRPVTISTQSNRSSGNTAPDQTDTQWANCGSTIFLPSTSSYTVLNANAASDLYSNTGIVPGTFFRANQTSNGISNNTVYVLGSDSFILTMDGAKLDITPSNAAANGWFYQGDALGAVTVTAYDSATGVFSSTAPVKVDDCVVFTTLGLGTGATFTRYWVNGIVNGGFTLASSIRGTTLTGWTGSVSTTTATVIRYSSSPEFAIATTSGSETMESRAASGSAVVIPHGLKVGDVLTRTIGNINLSPAAPAIPNGFWVTEIVSPTQFKMSSTYKGANSSGTATGNTGMVEPVKNIRMLGIQMDKTTRQWVRVAATQMNNTDSGKGSIVILFADVTPGRDGSFVLS